MTNKTFNVKAPVGNIIAKDVMTEAELRAFAIQINNNEEYGDTWREKMEKDEIDEVVEWFRGAGYTITDMEKVIHS